MDSTGLYFREMARFPLLKKEEEVELAKIVRAGIVEDEKGQVVSVSPSAKRAIDKLIAHNLRLTVAIAKKYIKRCKTMTLLDLSNEGAIGLKRAAEKFDPTKGYRFSTYAYWWVRQAITRAIAEQERSIRTPVHVVEKAQKVRKFAAKFLMKNGRLPNRSELAELLGVSEELIEAAIENSLPVYSLNYKIQRASSSDEDELFDFVGCESDSIDNLFSEQQRAFCDRYLSVLTPREQEIISLAYGLNGEIPLHNIEIGRLLNISRERVRQVRNMAMRKLRTHAERDRRKSGDDLFMTIVG